MAGDKEKRETPGRRASQRPSKAELKKLAAHAAKLSDVASGLRSHVAVMLAPKAVKRSWIEACVLSSTNERSLDTPISKAAGAGNSDPLAAVFQYCQSCCPGLVHIDDVYAYDRLHKIKKLRDYERFLEAYYTAHGTEVDKT
jgi:hypothetical protein